MVNTPRDEVRPTYLAKRGQRSADLTGHVSRLICVDSAMHMYVLQRLIVTDLSQYFRSPQTSSELVGLAEKVFLQLASSLRRSRCLPSLTREATTANCYSSRVANTMSGHRSVRN